MFTATDPIHVYTDGSYCAKRARAGYGWVCATGPRAAARARVITQDTNGKRKCDSLSGVMESAAIVDAICEFAPFGRKVVVHADNQALMNLMKRYRSGELTASAFMNAPSTITMADARRLVAALEKVEVELVWVKGHKDNFLNLVVDQMLRNTTLEGEDEAAGVSFAERAMDTCQATVRVKRKMGRGVQSWATVNETVYWAGQ